MAKNMAYIINGLVANINSCSENATETEDLINTNDKPVSIGDEYKDGKFYRNGAEVLSELETAQAELADMREALALLGVE